MARRAAIYLRESDSKLSKEGRWGIPVQKENAEKYCQEHSYVIHDYYIDPVGDSYELDRPALEQLRQDMRDDKFDVIVVDRFDRMARIGPLMDFIRSEAKIMYDVDLEFTLPEHQFDMDTLEGRLLAGAHMMAAQQYREMVKRNTQNARKKRAREGSILPGRRPPYGWRYIMDGDKCTLEFDPAPAPLRRRMVNETLAGRLPKQIAKGYTDDRIPLPTGLAHDWEPRYILRLLRDPVLKGEYVIYKWSAQKERRHKRDGTVYHPRVQRLRPEDDPDRVVVQVPAICTVDEWNMVQAIISGRKLGSSRHSSDPSATLLRGMVRCGYRGQVMTAVHRNYKGNVRWYYICRNEPLDGKRCNTGNIVATHKLDREVWDKFYGFLADPANVKKIYQDYVDQRLAGVRSDAEQLEFMNAHLEKLERDIELKSKRLAEEERDEIAAHIRIELGKALDARDTFKQMRDDAAEREVRRLRVRDEQEEAEAFMQEAWKHLQESDPHSYELRRGILLAFDLRAVVWNGPVEHTPLWVAVRGMDEMIDGLLTGNVYAHLLYAGDDLTLAPSILEDLKPVLAREARKCVTKSGRGHGPKSMLDLEREALFMSHTTTAQTDE